MKLDPATIEIHGEAADAYGRLGAERQRTLVAPEDDMWATFADMAEPHALTIGTQLVGRFSVDDDNQLHGFYVRDDFEEYAAELFVHVVDDMDITAAMASTVDPTFLSLSLAAGGSAEPVAVMYDHIARPVSDETVDVRPATSADHPAAVAFYRAETGSPEAFLNRSWPNASNCTSSTSSKLTARSQRPASAEPTCGHPATRTSASSSVPSSAVEERAAG